MPALRFFFRRDHILRNKKRIENLFKCGKYLRSGSLQMLYVIDHHGAIVAQHNGVKFIFFVPKKKMKKAVDRNYIKRILREMVRMRKHEIDINDNMVLEIGILYREKSKLDFKIIHHHFDVLWGLLLEALSSYAQKKV